MKKTTYHHQKTNINSRNILFYLIMCFASAILPSSAIAGMLCKLTPAFSPSVLMLEDFHPTSDLTRKNGSLYLTSGIMFEIKGIVRDEACVPIPNAIVQIWQADSQGHYAWEYSTDDKLIDSGKTKDPSFNYSGTSITNNLGEFHFKTILPGNIDVLTAPHINVKIYHDHFSPIETRAYFSGHPRNNNDESLVSFLSEDNEELDTSYEDSTELSEELAMEVIDKSSTESRVNKEAIFLIKENSKGKNNVRSYRYDIVLEGLSRFRQF